MKLHLPPKFLPFLQQNHQYSTGVLASLFAAKTQIPSSSSNSLFERIQLIRDPKSSVVPVLEQWVGEGRTVGKRQVQYLVRTMKDFKRFHHALQISQWMIDRPYFPLSSSDIALRLDLIRRVHGIKKAEEYFNNVSNYSKTCHVYGALLRGYVREKDVEKAEATMQKMRELDFATSSFPYNMLINLYTETVDFDKVKILIQEMNQKGIPLVKYTIRSQMAVNIATSDISGVERLLTLVEKDSRSDIALRLVLIHRVHGIKKAEEYFNNVSNYSKTCHVYGALLRGYVREKDVEKAEATMQKMRELDFATSSFPYNMLINLYTETVDFDKVKILIQEMNQKGIPLDKYTIRSQMAVNIATSDISGVERLLTLVEKDSRSDIALRLVLIHRVHGIKKAEEYFNNVSNYSKTCHVYGALLRGYVREKDVEKAEATMQKMRELDFATSSFPYNMLINLYTETVDFDKVKILIQEMNQKGIPLDKYTIRSQMAVNIATSDISGVERLLTLVEKDSPSFVDWKVYSMAASGYLKVGLVEKALAILKKMEAVLPYQKTNLAFEFIISLYARTGKKDELYRVWNKYKPSNEQRNVAYACMITSLMKLDDLEGAEKVFEEWESRCTMYDFRVLNRLLVAYCRKGIFEKAESAVNKAVEGRTAYASTWNILAKGYMEHNQMPKAVEMLKRAISVGRQGWWPQPVSLDASLDYLERQGDVSNMEDIILLLRKLGPLNRDIYHRWLRTCVATGGSVSEVLDQMKMDGFSANEETQNILETRPSL